MRRSKYPHNAMPISVLSKRTTQRKNTATFIIALMTASFYICWAPYAIRCILAMCGDDVSITSSALTILFAKLGIVVNPVIYIFYNKEVRFARFLAPVSKYITCFILETFSLTLYILFHCSTLSLDNCNCNQPKWCTKKETKRRYGYSRQFS